MFRLFQIDPETSAIHINVGALERHEHSDIFLAILDAFRENRIHELWRTLNRYPDTEERAQALVVLSQLMHELKHFVDIVLTPYGFHRLRTAFEFYRGASHLVARNEPKIFPLNSGLDPFVRKRLNVSAYDETLAAGVAALTNSRSMILAAENQQHKHESGYYIELGGDAILEALAFGYQIEYLQHPPIITPSLHRLMPYAFNPDTIAPNLAENMEISQFDLTYRWHYPLSKAFTQEMTIHSQRLMYLLLYAALCGSFAKDANYQEIRIGQAVNESKFFPGRFVDDRLPSRRLPDLLAWTGNYVEKGGKIPDTWEQAWELVNEAHQEQWGTTVVEEIRADIESDERLIAMARAGDPSATLEGHPLHVFVDLIASRRRLFDRLKADPIGLLHPLKLAAIADEYVDAPIYYVYPQGADEPLQGTEPVIEEYIKLPDSLAERMSVSQPGIQWPPKEGEVVAQKVIYSSWALKTTKQRSVKVGSEAAWPVLLGYFAPVYKLALYGLRYRTMLEYDLVKAKAYLENEPPGILWHDFYLEVEDVSSPYEYFHFYMLEKAQCDLCSTAVDRDQSVIASAGTVRASHAFRQHYRALLGEMADYAGLGKDWSVWLLCKSCLDRFLQ